MGEMDLAYPDRWDGDCTGHSLQIANYYQELRWEMNNNSRIKIAGHSSAHTAWWAGTKPQKNSPKKRNMGFGSYYHVVSPTNLKKFDSVAPVRKITKPRFRKVKSLNGRNFFNNKWKTFIK